jgi:hypothetical protein
MLTLLRGSISRARTSDSGRLRLDFDHAVRLAVEPHHDYEVWEMSGSSAERVVCAIGGELVA